MRLMRGKKFDIVIVGAGISGSVLAERYASIGRDVLVLEKRDHIGGNCYDHYTKEGILVSKYGAHLFHTNYEEVWEYINRFSDWYFYEHRVLATIDGKLVPVPVNITTVNELLGQDIRNEREMKQWLNEHTLKNDNPQNGEEAALARVGPDLYEKIFKHYTKKQWDKYPFELDASVLNRIPVRTNFDDRYFTDKYQYLPQDGYTPLFKRMLNNPHITVALNTDFFEIRDTIKKYSKLFYTGPIDQFFDFKYSIKRHLEYRSINFVFETHNKEYYQSNSVINYPNTEDFTRIVEYKRFTKQKHPQTAISKEYSVDEGEPYYPVPNPDNHAIYNDYQKEAEKLTNIHFVGRLANYKYFNMDEAFKNALDLFNSLEKPAEKKFRMYSTKKPQPTVMIIDDDEAILEAMYLLLNEDGFHALAYDHVPSLPEILKQKPELILLDVFLANEDGRQLTRKIRSHKELNEIPIIMVSAISTVEKAAIQAGADKFINKPFDLNEISREVHTLIKDQQD